MTDYIGSTETAKLARQILKEAFPGVKFSVRVSKYSGGASIYVRWEDGPTGKEVDELLSPLDGTYFDGMIDYSGTRYALLDGNKVSFGGTLMSTRTYSQAAIAEAVSNLRDNANSDVRDQITLEAYERGQLWNVQPFGGCYTDTSAAAEIGKLLAARRYGLEALPSKTAARIQFAGDDGYGMGTVGDLTKPEHERVTSAGYCNEELVKASQAQKDEILPPNVIRLSDLFHGATVH